MSAQGVICIRFPNGTKEFAFPEAIPEIGDKLARGRDEWEVVAVAEDATGTVVVTVGPPSRKSPGATRWQPSEDNPSSLDELQERAEVAKAVSASLRESSSALIREGKIWRNSETGEE